MKRWTIAHEAFFCCGVACCSVVAVALVAVGWPVILVQWIWKDCTCWESDANNS